MLQNRQELEALEEGARVDGTSANADDSPLLSPDEAVELIRCGDRRVSVLIAQRAAVFDQPA